MTQPNETKITPVIMCGGAGTRIWPESRESLPKQFIALVGQRSTFQEILLTVSQQNLSNIQFTAPIIITNRDYRFLVAEQIAQIGVDTQIVLEPERRDSAAAVAVATILGAKDNPKAVIAVLAADHIIEKREAFITLCGEAARAASLGNIVTFGITPDYPATGYGYIRPGAGIDGAAGDKTALVRKIERFVEKPDLATAERYIADGYFWNSGNFIFRADVMLAELERFEPEIFSAAAAAVQNAKQDLDFLVLDGESFAKAPRKSIDYAVMEKTSSACVLPAAIGWSDVGTWASVFELAQKDADGNSVLGDGVVVSGKNVHIRSPDMLTTVVGLDDVMVITTPDALMVVSAAHSAKVKDLVELLRSQKRREVISHKHDFRPWGYYTSIDQGPRHQVKRIVVRPGQKLSLQKHFHRAEHWIVVKGTAEVTRNDEVLAVHENESIYLPMGCVHRLANPGKIDLELIEVQTGSYLGEDDIIRLEDVYRRS